jgi:arabinoxylan arabinofuranohydrolase
METQGASFTNHPAVIAHKGGDYFFYHNGALPGSSDYQRSIAVENFNYGPNSVIPNMRRMTAGAPRIGALDPYVRIEAETIPFSSGLMTATSNDGGIHVAGISPNDYRDRDREAGLVFQV